VPAVVDAVSPLPVVAAGGIADGRGVAAALTLGAAGALIGTRFYASHEALGHESAKQQLVHAKGEDTLRTRVFDLVRGYPWPEHFTGRALANAFTDRWHGREASLSEDLEAQRDLYTRAGETGDTDVLAVFAGEGVDAIGSVEPAETIMRQMVRETRVVLDRRPAV